MTFFILITSQDPTWMTFYPLKISQERSHFLSRKLRGLHTTAVQMKATPIRGARVILSPLRPQMVRTEHGEGAVCAVTHYMCCHFCE